MTPAGALKDRLLAVEAVVAITRDVYLMVGEQAKPVFITIACEETPEQSIGAINGSSLITRLTAWSADYDQAHELAAAIRGAMFGVSLDAEGISIDGLQCTAGPRDSFAEVKSGDYFYAIVNTFSAHVRRT